MSDSDGLPENVKDLWSYEGNELEQARYLAENTTAEQRMQWLEDMVELFSEQLLERRRREAKEFGYVA